MKMKTLIRSIIFLASGLLIFIFNQRLVPIVNYVFAGGMILFVLDELFTKIIDKTFFEQKIYLPLFCIQIIVLILLIILGGTGEKEIIFTCEIFGIWELIREVLEIRHCLAGHFKKLIVIILNILESLVVLVFVIIMMIHPSVSHAYVHIIILGCELILEIIWGLIKKHEMKSE